MLVNEISCADEVVETQPRKTPIQGPPEPFEQKVRNWETEDNPSGMEDSETREDLLRKEETELKTEWYNDRINWIKHVPEDERASAYSCYEEGLEADSLDQDIKALEKADKYVNNPLNFREESKRKFWKKKFGKVYPKYENPPKRFPEEFKLQKVWLRDREKYRSLVPAKDFTAKTFYEDEPDLCENQFLGGHVKTPRHGPMTREQFREQSNYFNTRKWLNHPDYPHSKPPRQRLVSEGSAALAGRGLEKEQGYQPRRVSTGFYTRTSNKSPLSNPYLASDKDSETDSMTPEEWARIKYDYEDFDEYVRAQKEWKWEMMWRQLRKPRPPPPPPPAPPPSPPPSIKPEEPVLEELYPEPDLRQARRDLQREIRKIKSGAYDREMFDL